MAEKSRKKAKNTRITSKRGRPAARANMAHSAGRFPRCSKDSETPRDLEQSGADDEADNEHSDQQQEHSHGAGRIVGYLSAVQFGFSHPSRLAAGEWQTSRTASRQTTATFSRLRRFMPS